MKTIGAGKFKEKCLALLDEVAQEHETIVVTKRGKPVALVTPVTEKEQSLREKLKGSILQENDIISPVDIAWDAVS
jgi:prevent-host-death family protein